MAEATTRRSPGRPAKQAQETKTVKKSIPIKRNEKEDTNKEFEIVRGGGIVYMLPQKAGTLQDGQVLAYSSSAQKFINQNQSGGVGSGTVGTVDFIVDGGTATTVSNDIIIFLDGGGA